jgi:hypothetical protein
MVKMSVLCEPGWKGIREPQTEKEMSNIIRTFVPLPRTIKFLKKKKEISSIHRTLFKVYIYYSYFLLFILESTICSLL